jgi:phage N-6-adenine-methyltransferase
MTPDLFEAFAASIGQMGVLEPTVVVCDGKILAGWERYRAAVAKNRVDELVFIEYSGDDPFDQVVARHIGRIRSKGTWACVGARLVDDVYAPEGKELMAEGGRGLAPSRRSNRKNRVSQDCETLHQPFRATKRAAQALNGLVGERYIDMAVGLKRHSPDLFAAVEAGEMELLDADEVRTDKQQPFPLAAYTGDHEWFSPKKFIDAARRVLGHIDLDPASCDEANRVVDAARFFSIEDDGLKQIWKGKIWLNPPYSDLAKFGEKLVKHYRSGEVTEAIALVPSSSETVWFQKLGAVASALAFPKGRIGFWRSGQGEAKSDPSLHGHTVMYLGTQLDKFYNAFSPLGLVWIPFRAQ